MANLRRFILYPLSISLCCLIPVLGFAATEHIDKIVAVVNDQVIAQSELDQEIIGLREQMTAAKEKLPAPAQLRTLALDNLIAKDLQMQAAKMVGFKLSADKVNQSIEAIAKQHGLTVNELPDALKHQGMDFEQFKKQISSQLLIQELQQRQLAGSFKIDPKQIDALAKKIAANPGAYQKTVDSGLSYHLYDVVIPLPATATADQMAEAKKVFDALGALITKGMSLPDAVKESGMSGSVQATDLNWQTQAQLPPAFVKLVEQLKPGQIAPPGRAPNGIHIVQLLAVKKNAVAAATTTITETHLRHLLIKTDALTPDSTVERRLLNIRNDLLHGTAFATAVEENSQDPGSIANGGDLGWVKPGSLDPKFEKAMDLLKVDEISQPVKTQFGWHLIQVLARRQISDPDLAYKQQAQNILFNQKMTVAVKDFINELKSQAYIKIYPTTTP